MSEHMISVDRERELADQLLALRPFTWDLPEWKPEWPTLRVTSWSWGETYSAGDRLELWITLGELELMLADYSDGPLFLANPRHPRNVAAPYPLPGLDEDTSDEIGDALDEMRIAFEGLVDNTSAGLVYDLRNRARDWLDHQLSREGGTVE